MMTERCPQISNDSVGPHDIIGFCILKNCNLQDDGKFPFFRTALRALVVAFHCCSRIFDIQQDEYKVRAPPSTTGQLSQVTEEM